MPQSTKRLNFVVPIEWDNARKKLMEKYPGTWRSKSDFWRYAMRPEILKLMAGYVK